MALKGLSSLESEPYICRDDPCRTPEDGATVFHLRNIPSDVMARIDSLGTVQQLHMGEEGATQNYVNQKGKKHREAFRFGVSGWDNFPDAEGKPIAAEFEQIMEGGVGYNVLTKACLNKVGFAILNEVGEAAFLKNSLTDEGRKKYEALLSAFGSTGTSPAGTVTTAPKSNEDAEDRPEKENTGETQ